MLKEKKIPHVQGCLVQETRNDLQDIKINKNTTTLTHMQAYLSGELDYVPTAEYYQNEIFKLQHEITLLKHEITLLKHEITLIKEELQL